MRRSRILAKIRGGRIARIASTGTPNDPLPAVAAHFGYDGVWIDGEHRAWNPERIAAMIGQHHAADIDCLWRPSTKEKNALYRLLEDGAAGLMITNVPNADEARALVEAVKFPPLGDRGLCGGGRDASYWVGKPDDYPEQANRETFLVVQIETPQALEKVDAIAAVPGVDLLFLGPGDMSLRLGCTAAVDDPKMLDAQTRIAAAARRHGKAWGRPVGSAADLRAMAAAGAQLIAYGSEFAALNTHFAACAQDFDRECP
jgi:2-keto-3-deoxy-L-rhamnonate aldolase RhmA